MLRGSYGFLLIMSDVLWFLPSTQPGDWGKESPGAFCDQGVGQRVAVPGWCLIKQNRRQMEDLLPSPFPLFFLFLFYSSAAVGSWGTALFGCFGVDLLK